MGKQVTFHVDYQESMILKTHIPGGVKPAITFIPLPTRGIKDPDQLNTLE